MNMHARCGVTGLGPRAGEAWPTLVRLTAADCAAIVKAKAFAGCNWPAGDPPEPGLYAVCQEVATWLRPRRAKALGKAVAELTRYDLC